MSFDLRTLYLNDLTLYGCTAQEDIVLEGVELAHKGAADELRTRSFPEVATLLETSIDDGGPPCGKTHGIGDDDLVASAEWMGGAAVMAATAERRTMGF